MNVWALGLSCETPGASGLHTTARENSKRAHLRVPALQTPKFHEKTPRETQKERKWWREKGKKKREILGLPPLRGLRGPTLQGPTLGGPKGVYSSLFVFFILLFFLLKKKANRLKHQFWPKSVWPKSATQILTKVGQFFLAKVGLGQQVRSCRNSVPMDMLILGEFLSERKIISPAVAVFVAFEMMVAMPAVALSLGTPRRLPTTLWSWLKWWVRSCKASPHLFHLSNIWQSSWLTFFRSGYEDKVLNICAVWSHSDNFIRYS